MFHVKHPFQPGLLSPVFSTQSEVHAEALSAHLG